MKRHSNHKIIRRKPKEDNEENVDQTSIYERIFIIIFIILSLLAIYLSGGNGQHWYPGQPYQDR